MRKTHLGEVRGESARAGVLSWKGIPYAKPPVGDLRWKAPDEPDAWTTTRATSPSATPARNTAASTARAPTTSTTRPSARRSNQAVGSEDCLYLNIWRPATGDAEPAGDRVLPRRQQRLRLHGRPGVRRRRARQDRQCGRRHGQLPARHLRLPQPAAAEDRADAANDSGNFALLDIIKALQFVQHEHRGFRRQPGATSR